MFTELAPNIFPEFDAIRALVLNLTLICFFLALLIMLAVQVWKNAFKQGFQRKVFEEWINTLFSITDEEYSNYKDMIRHFIDKRYPDINNSKDFEMLFRASYREDRSSEGLIQYPNYVFGLPRRLFMKKIENDVQIVLSNPNTYRRLFLAITAGAATDYKLEILTWTARERAALQRDYEVPSGATGAFDVVAQAATRNLDSLQMRLSLLWVNKVRRWAILFGLAVGFALNMILFSATIGAEPYSGDVPDMFELLKLYFFSIICILLGVVSGFLSSFLYDFFGHLLRWDRDTL